MSKKIVIIDYSLGNLSSVYNVFNYLGQDVLITSDPEVIIQSDAAVLPGVGSFKDAMLTLNTTGIGDAIFEFIKTGKHLLGICLGMQLLFSKSEEFGETNGLNIISGSVKRFSNFSSDNLINYKVPQIGWNKINYIEGHQLLEMTPLKNISFISDYMYFIHSYYVVPDLISIKLTHTNYAGIDYCSSILKDNIFAVQFHPEKSSKKGIQIYKDWLDIL
ncbi:imidazole glycerol phosphate synthase subunit HisH [Fluviispira vulneris]|uniref:imidazole glycerol phosphate synthase subunit HisH n=1 Tax=Fluviispira vulneris TaxID=2763012 RepID=UPI001C93E7F6|nr:imidazole glycerol phosphate synthase subunit HisH [Fluviispira vulneris]